MTTSKRWFRLVFLWHTNHYRLLIPNPFLYIQTVLFQTIQFRISTLFSSIWFKDKTLSGATTPGHSEPESDGNEGVLRISQSSSITRISPSDCLVSYLEHSFGESYSSAEKHIFYSPSQLGHRILVRVSYPSEEKQSVYSTTPANWATLTLDWKTYKELNDSNNRY